MERSAFSILLLQEGNTSIKVYIPPKGHRSLKIDGTEKLEGLTSCKEKRSTFLTRCESDRSARVSKSQAVRENQWFSVMIP